MLNKKYLVGIGIAIIIGIGVAVYGYSTMNQQGETNNNNSVGVSDNVQVIKTPANATGKHYTVQFNESIGVTAQH